MPERRYQRIGLAVGAPAFIVVALTLADANYHRLTMPGDMNTGHEALSCGACHLPEIGTARQQLQAQISYWLGGRDDWIHFGTVPVSNEACIACHDRPDDRHPVYRFQEPRFKKARDAIGADRCISCHQEHKGVRVTQTGTFCRNCHEDTKIKNDPIDVPHDALIAQARWATCLGCHDFHGNHRYQAPQRLDQAFSRGHVEDYLAGRMSLYSEEKKWPAKREEELHR